LILLPKFPHAGSKGPQDQQEARASAEKFPEWRKPKNSTIKPFSTLSVPCMKFQWGEHGPSLPIPIAGEL